MFSSITTKLALKKIGLSSDALDFSSPAPEPKKLKKNKRDLPPGTVPGLDDVEDETSSGWPAWMSVKKLPLTVQPWLSPPPPPVAVAPECPKVGDLAPLDRDRKLTFGGGRMVLVVFLRCVGCACTSTSRSLNPHPHPRRQTVLPRDILTDISSSASQSRRRPSSPCGPSPTATRAP
jgi:hypothetical protein